MKKELPIWDEYRKTPLRRIDTLTGKEITLERGVNFFVHYLEKLGAKPLYSCEGHPNGFYILFKAPYRVARQVASAGFFNVSIEKGGRWRLDFSYAHADERDKRRTLRWAAHSWFNQFALGTAPLMRKRQEETRKGKYDGSKRKV